MEEVIDGIGGGECVLPLDDPAEVSARASGCAAAIQFLSQCRNVMQPKMCIRDSSQAWPVSAHTMMAQGAPKSRVQRARRAMPSSERTTISR